MRTLAFVLVVLCSSVTAQAQNREWKDATVTKITAETTEGVFAVVPIGGAVVGGPIIHHKVFYDIETEDVTFVLAWVNKKHPLNVTLHGKTKIALDKNGRDAHILDDAGKEVKIPIARKIAKPREATPANAQQPSSIPPSQNGNSLLESCSHVVHVLDSPSSEVSLNQPAFAEKFGWCTGYLQAIRDAIIISEKSFVMASSEGVKLTGPFPSVAQMLGLTGLEHKRPKTAQELAVPLSMICIPQEASSVGQLARVVVKWLRDHPERLHEDKTILTLEAFRDAFPCEAGAPKTKPDTK